jgi:flagellar hook-associated protein 3 FlgL
MQTTFISTLAASTAMRQSILNMQAQLADAQKEVATGRLADVGLSLGGQTGQTVSLRNEQSRLQTITNTNSIVSTNLSATSQALTDLQTTAQGVLNTLVSNSGSNPSAQAIQSQGASALQSLIAGLNTTSGNQYIFAGVNTDVRPIASYGGSPPSASKQAVDNAFQAAFGMSQSDPAVASISPSDMQAFLDNQFAALFQGPDWSSNWSSASDSTVKSRISPSELADTSVSANQPAMQKLAMAYTMLSDLGLANMSASTQQVVVQTASKAVSAANGDLTDLQAGVGVTQQRVSSANNRMSVQMNILATQDGNLEQVDPYTSATKVNDLQTQIETAYSLTAQLHQLSLLNYLPTN